MSLFLFLTVLQAIVAAALVGVILMQRSEGGGLGMGGSPSGLMSARGAADLMTRITSILATLFVVLSIIMAIVAVGAGTTSSIDTSLERGVPVSEPDPLAPAEGQTATASENTAETPDAPTADDPLAGAAR